jgi:soluble lytic murein transglycosylase
MQLLPSTADYIAHKSCGTQFEHGDLADAQINIAYGSWYLRYLLDHYDGNVRLAIAAYNAGETNVDRWVAKAGGPDEFTADDDIPFPETREYVTSVEQKQKEYRKNYARELGIRE